jgi:acyl-CoA synthetase (AMP-forming)/AMP-acid ligase II
VSGAFVTEVDGAVGAVVISELAVEELRDAARKRLSAFKVPTVWLLLSSDDEVPRGTTGKVDARKLRALLREQT